MKDFLWRMMTALFCYIELMDVRSFLSFRENKSATKALRVNKLKAKIRASYTRRKLSSKRLEVE